MYCNMPALDSFQSYSVPRIISDAMAFVSSIICHFLIFSYRMLFSTEKVSVSLIQSEFINQLFYLNTIKMKKQIISDSKGRKLPLFVALLFVALFSTAEMNAQTKPAAVLNANGVVQLPTNVPLAKSYQISLSSFGFQTEEQAIQYFSTKSFDGFFFRANFSQNKAVLYLDANVHPGWTVSQWNNLLNSQTTATPLLN
jgi:hypothetical protein